MHLAIYHPNGTPTIKIKALHLASIEGWVKRLIQPYLSLFSLLGARLSMTLTVRTIKRN